MAGKKLRYEVEVDASDAVSDFKKVGKAAETAGKAIKKGLEVKPDTAKIDTFISDLKQVRDEADNAAKAIEQIKKFAPTVDDSDIKDVVVGLRSAGVEFDAIEAKAKELGDTLEQVGSTKIKGLGDNVRNVSTDMDGLRDSSDQSRSVLANMAGNAAQDLGELGGVVGTLGVGIGQLAEYATEGNIKMGELAKVAGPMAGLAAATLLVQNYMSNVAKTEAFNKEEVESYTDAIERAGPGIGAINDKLREAEAITGLLEDNNPFTQFTDEEVDITPMLDEFGLTLEQVQAVIADTGEALDFLAIEVDGTKLGFHNVTPELVNFIGLMNAANVPMATQMDIIQVLQQQQANYAAGVEETGTANEFFAATVDDINRSLREQEVAARSADQNWGIILDDLRDGTIDTQNAADAWNILREALDLTDQEMRDLALEKLNEDTEHATEATEEAAAAAREWASALAEAGDAIDDIDADDIDNIATGLQSALDVGDATVDFQSIKVNLRTAFSDLETFIKEEGVDIDWAALLDTSMDVEGLTPELAGLITQVRDQFQSGITAAFEIGGVGAAQHFIDSFIPQLLALGLTPAQAYEMVGLGPDGSAEVFLKPIIDAEAKADALAILGSLAGVDPNNPIIAYITAQVQVGAIDPVIAEIISLLIAQEYDINVTPQLAEFTPAQIAAAQAVLDASGAAVTVPSEIGVPDTSKVLAGDILGGTTLPTVTLPSEVGLPDVTAADAALDDLVSEVRTAVIGVQARATGLNSLQSAGGRIDALTTAIRTAIIGVQARAEGLNSLQSAGGRIDSLATTVRTATIGVEAKPTGPNSLASEDSALNMVARDNRVADINVRLPNAAEADYKLDRIADDRYADIIVRTIGGGGTAPAPPTGGTFAVEPFGGEPMAATTGVATATLAAPRSAIAFAAPAAPVTNNLHVTVQAAVIGNRFEVERAVSKALRAHTRLNGSRN